MMGAAQSTFEGHGKTCRPIQESCFLSELLCILLPYELLRLSLQ